MTARAFLLGVGAAVVVQRLLQPPAGLSVKLTYRDGGDRFGESVSLVDSEGEGSFEVDDLSKKLRDVAQDVKDLRYRVAGWSGLDNRLSSEFGDGVDDSCETGKCWACRHGVHAGHATEAGGVA